MRALQQELDPGESEAIALGTDVFAVGENGTILHYDVSSWNPMTSFTFNDLVGIWGSSSTNVYAVGESGTILRYDGNQWNLIENVTNNYLTGIWGASSNDIFLVGSSCGTSSIPLFHYDGDILLGMYTVWLKSPFYSIYLRHNEIYDYTTLTPVSIIFWIKGSSGVKSSGR